MGSIFSYRIAVNPRSLTLIYTHLMVNTPLVNEFSLDKIERMHYLAEDEEMYS